MEEIKVGEYVRSGNGIIGKVIDLDNIFVYLDREVGYREETDSFFNYIHKKILIKHSPNIIDLIEVGDYVNGYKVTDVCNEEPCPSGKCVDIDCDRPSEFCTLWETDIKEIVTKEQFNSIKYVIGE